MSYFKTVCRFFLSFKLFVNMVRNSAFQFFWNSRSNNFRKVWCLNYSQSVDLGYLAKCFFWSHLREEAELENALLGFKFSSLCNNCLECLHQNWTQSWRKSLKTFNTITRFSEQFQTSYLTSKNVCPLPLVIRLWISQLLNISDIIWPRILKQTLYSSLCLHLVYMAER